LANIYKTYYRKYDFEFNEIVFYWNGAKRLSIRKAKKRDDSPMPATGAGLIRFYSESDSPGLKIGPYWTVAIAIAFVALILILHFLNI
jgi:preprotein translocase subunit Sec61beta